MGCTQSKFDNTNNPTFEQPSMSLDLPPQKKTRMTESPRIEQLSLDNRALDKYSRQIAALGAETTAKLTKMKVLIYGMRGVGIETAKNLLLQGVGGLTIIDSNPTTMSDVGLNFFLHEEDVGAPRADVIKSRLQELNTISIVNVSSTFSDNEMLSHDAVVITLPLPMSEIVRINELCRSSGIAFFNAFVGGVSGSIFTDLGPKHIVNDFNGDRLAQKLVTDIFRAPDNEQECLIRYETPEGKQPIALMDGSYDITEVVGIVGLHGTFQATHPDRDPVKTIRIPFALPEGVLYTSGGLITEKKIPVHHPMESLASKIRTPGNTFSEPPSLVLTDLINFGAEYQQHVSLWACMKYLEKTGAMPRAYHAEDVAAVIACAKELLASEEIVLEDFTLDEAFVTRFAEHAQIELQPVSAFIGGVLAQEVVKCTGKFTPIPGFLHFSATEALPDQPPTAEERAPRGSRYDELALIYGWPFVEKLGNLQYFMVGCGALGCEFMKNFALAGICCGPTGKLVVTDPDRIELSNLSRQFLFREHNVGQPKSRAAAAMATVMNRDFKVESLEMLVGPKSENAFNDDFWAGLDGVCNALDNMEARQYVDIQCVKYEKSLLESGTTGTSGNIDTICPFKTRTYRDGGNADEAGGVPMCTLRNFPHLTDHCIEWARDQFELMFVKLGKSCEVYLSNPAQFERDIRTKADAEPGAAFFDLRSVASLMRAAANPSIGACAQLAFDLFHFFFRDRILDLQAAFPADARMIVKKDGQTIDRGPFWGEKKRYPAAAAFNPHDEAHLSFMTSATCLFIVMLGIMPKKKENEDTWMKQFRSAEWILGITRGLTVPAYMQAPVKSEGLESDVSSVSLTESLTVLFADLKAVSENVTLGNVETADFEKDDDLNFHIAFITATANLRCDNYSIKRTDFHSCKVIAGKIIAAIATTTAAVCGLVLLEFFKLQLNKPTEALMNRQVGLAVNTYVSFTQEHPKTYNTHTVTVTPGHEDIPADGFDELGRVKAEYLVKETKVAYPDGHSVWDKITCSGSLTLREFTEWLRNEHKLGMTKWDFVYGHRTVTDAETKKKSEQAVSTPIFPSKPVLDYSLVPSIDLPLNQATTAIMRNPACKPAQGFINLWKEFKALGHVPPQPAAADVMNDSWTLKQILMHMSDLAERDQAAGRIDTKAVSSLEGRKMWVIPGDETPMCIGLESQIEIETLCAIKISLV